MVWGTAYQKNILVGESMLPDSRDDAHGLFCEVMGFFQKTKGVDFSQTEATHFQHFASQFYVVRISQL
jgi:hypothetical protein